MFSLSEILLHPLLPQVAPLLFLFLGPLVILTCQRHILGLFDYISSMLQTISSALPWNWGSSSSPKVHHTKLKKKHPTTRREQLAANGHANPRALLSIFQRTRK